LKATVSSEAHRSRDRFPTKAGDDIIAYKPVEVDNRSLVVFDSGDEVRIAAGPEGIRFLLVSGRPIREPVAWYGPIVMNTGRS
jgi:redox-sensitive bicupin YhaK (pirin superfamily)